MQRLQARSTINALLSVRIDGQAVGAATNGATELGATVVIHVGPPKTGTKTVQKELADHTSSLELDGWTMLRPSHIGKGMPKNPIQVLNVAAC